MWRPLADTSKLDVAPSGGHDYVICGAIWILDERYNFVYVSIAYANLCAVLDDTDKICLVVVGCRWSTGIGRRYTNQRPGVQSQVRTNLTPHVHRFIQQAALVIILVQNLNCKIQNYARDV